jgi:hypothetical protein
MKRGNKNGKLEGNTCSRGKSDVEQEKLVFLKGKSTILHAHAVHAHAMHAHAVHAHTMHAHAVHPHAMHGHAVHTPAMHAHAVHPTPCISPPKYSYYKNSVFL